MLARPLTPHLREEASGFYAEVSSAPLQRVASMTVEARAKRRLRSQA